MDLPAGPEDGQLFLGQALALQVGELGALQGHIGGAGGGQLSAEQVHQADGAPLVGEHGGAEHAARPGEEEGVWAGDRTMYYSSMNIVTFGTAFQP